VLLQGTIDFEALSDAHVLDRLPVPVVQSLPFRLLALRHLVVDGTPCTDEVVGGDFGIVLSLKFVAFLVVALAKRQILLVVAQLHLSQRGDLFRWRSPVDATLVAVKRVDFVDKCEAHGGDS
jgi:hypothetical protein